MIVYYYGGTSPTNRALEFSYSMHMYAAQTLKQKALFFKTGLVSAKN